VTFHETPSVDPIHHAVWNDDIAMRRRSPQATATGVKTDSVTRNNSDSMEAGDDTLANSNSRIEQQGLLLEIEDGSSFDEPKKGFGGRNILLVNDPLHSYQGRRRFIALLLVTGLLMVVYLGK
jgi:hypothetical protein